MPNQLTIGELISQSQGAMTSTAELAQRLGIRANTVYRHKYDANIPGAYTLRKYCHVLKINDADMEAAAAESRERRRRLREE